MQVEKLINGETSWTACPECQGLGRNNKRLPNKVRRQYQNAVARFERTQEGPPPERPKRNLQPCLPCDGFGLLPAASPPPPDPENYPHVAIIGGGIGGVALAIACLHRGIPFTLYERDNSFDERSQGYGLTLQQASRAITGLGVPSLKEGVGSTRHVVHTTEGKIIGEWGIRKWGWADDKTAPKRTNVHIARQSLRLALLDQLNEHGSAHVQWGHQLVDYRENDTGDGVALSFQVGGEIKKENAGLLVGADGIRSSVRRLLIGEEASPLRYLGCIVILGICPLKDLADVDSPLLDSATVFQTANGHERIYMMPYCTDSIMWQLSFPMPEAEAQALSDQGTKALKEEALRRCQWHLPIPQVLAATQTSRLSGYPVYDRALLDPEMLEKGSHVTLLGDAAHPMSPFKGQGANQALLDSLALARCIVTGCRPLSKWREAGIRESVLTAFEAEMLERTGPKVRDSAEAAEFLHSETVLYEGDEPRGRSREREEDA